MTGNLTPKESRAIAALHKLSKTWPDSLWLFSAAGGLYVMKNDPMGERWTLPNGGMDPSAIAAVITNIENDGGDW